MDQKIAATRREVLVEIVKLAQKQGMKGNKGNWKEFLNIYDKKLGASLSDPARRSTEALVAFLKTFNEEEDLKFFDKVMQCHSNRDAVEKFKQKSADIESPEQRLVRTTLEHPQYLSNYSFPSYTEDWLITKRSKKSKAMRSTAMVAVDCEMVLCDDGSEALVRVCVVDRNFQVKLDKLVKPNKAVADYRTDITGVCANDLDGVTCSLADIQKSMKKLLSHGTILVGHSLNNDLQALKIDHARVIDTSFVFKYENGAYFRRPSLTDLCKYVLSFKLRKEGSPHNCLDDACAAMKLVLASIEGGVNNVVPLVHKDVPEIEMAKLLVHRIPISVPQEELHNIIPGDFTVEMKANKKAGTGKYSVLAVFKNQQEANRAFEDLDGNQEQDLSGRPQKFISFELSIGIAGSLYVRKMAHDDHLGQAASKKRSFQDEDSSVESKKLKIDQTVGELAGSNQCDSHMKEIERLKQELSQRDREITNLNKIIIALTRKQGL